MNAQLDLPIIPPTVLSGVVEIGRREGAEVDAWFVGTGLDATRLLAADTVKVSYRQAAAAVLRRAVRDMPGKPLGMLVGGRDMLLSMGMLGVAMRSCATVSDAVSVALDLHLASGSLIDVDLEHFDDEVALRFRERRPEPELRRFLIEEAMATLTVFARTVAGSDWSPSRVELTYPPPPYAAEYTRFLRCRVEFSADANRAFFPTKVLDVAFPTHHEPTRALAVDACRRLLGNGRKEPDLVTAVEAVLERDLRHALSAADVAGRLHMSERTLRRQLAGAERSFSAIRDRVRERHAIRLLRESTLPVAIVAREVGYSDIRDFRRAYIRWTGHSPSAERQLTG
ncbi:AraC family transcriptional regulator [Nocardia sp. NBC_01503]|uniref:AraC family transcriptional regulator n=1 Tax=Nocardia sp. NBC_01503 TaxID=2975997 RepID=UPI002E7BA102|nr:AraC family transcriptional regulator ligand-binding domain-containing protein [Nocardia sp. NBC_01503]WTL30080.1 AraC family transcriptional regulator [Nocardia sp. NBC_01503]